MNDTIFATRRKKKASASNDSKQLLSALIEIIDKLSHENEKTKFLLQAIRLLCQAKQLLWRKHWVILRRHVLDKMKE